MTGVDRTIKEFGLALGLAIILDAFVIRLTLVPALMHLLNEHAWWIPRWLDRILPRLTIEAPEDRGHMETTAHPQKES
jgi:RND superfamily putative drug exporter